MQSAATVFATMSMPTSLHILKELLGKKELLVAGRAFATVWLPTAIMKPPTAVTSHVTAVGGH
jgi:hypothetical protein